MLKKLVICLTLVFAPTCYAADILAWGHTKWENGIPGASHAYSTSAEIDIDVVFIMLDGADTATPECVDRVVPFSDVGGDDLFKLAKGGDRRGRGLVRMGVKTKLIIQAKSTADCVYMVVLH